MNAKHGCCHVIIFYTCFPLMQGAEQQKISSPYFSSVSLATILWLSHQLKCPFLQWARLVAGCVCILITSWWVMMEKSCSLMSTDITLCYSASSMANTCQIHNPANPEMLPELHRGTVEMPDICFENVYQWKVSLKNKAILKISWISQNPEYLMMNS